MSSASKDDPERLLAEALRAQATHAPAPAGETTSSFGGYGLLSGSDLRVPLARVDDLTERAEGSAGTERLAVPRQVPASLILLLALFLGLAAGAIVGLLTLI